MGNVYFGSVFAAATGNWNTVANWFSYPGFSTSNSTIPAVPLGRLPNASTDSVQLYNGTVSTGPTGGYAGTVAIPGPNNATIGPGQGGISAGSYSGTVTLSCSGPMESGPVTISGGSFSNTVTISGGNRNTSLISGGNFSSTVQFNSGLYTAEVTGGTFTGSFIVPVNFVNFSGGTYSPTISITYHPSTSTVTVGAIKDPGFWVGGATFSPNWQLIGFPDILGTGMI